MNKSRSYKARFGNDINKIKMYRKYTIARCQAKYWNQPFDLTFKQYYNAYQKAGLTANDTGRKADSLNIARINTKLGWNVKNICFKKRTNVHYSNQEGSRKRRIRLKDADYDARHYVYKLKNM